MEVKHLELVHSELLKLVMQAADPHLGLQLRKKGNQEVVKERETERGSAEARMRKNNNNINKAFILFC